MKICRVCMRLLCRTDLMSAARTTAQPEPRRQSANAQIEQDSKKATNKISTRPKSHNLIKIFHRECLLVPVFVGHFPPQSSRHSECGSCLLQFALCLKNYPFQECRASHFVLVCARVD